LARQRHGGAPRQIAPTPHRRGAGKHRRASGGAALLRLRARPDETLRLAAVEALGNVQGEGGSSELSHIVDDAGAPPLLIKRAIISLDRSATGRDSGAHPWSGDRAQGVSFLPESSFGLFVIGEEAVDPLLKIAQDQDAAYSAWAKENNRAPAGTYAKTALVLGDIGDRERSRAGGEAQVHGPGSNKETSRLLSNWCGCSRPMRWGGMRAAQARRPSRRW